LPIISTNLSVNGGVVAGGGVFRYSLHHLWFHFLLQYEKNEKNEKNEK